MKGNIILDLDETLINSIDVDQVPKIDRAKASKLESYRMDDIYSVFVRPGMENFLDYIFSNYNVSVWTAATKDYAISVVENVILKDHPERKIDYLFFRYHRNLSILIAEKDGIPYKKAKEDYTKNLNILWDVFALPGFEKGNTIIIDDKDEVYELQKESCIHVPPFELLPDQGKGLYNADKVLITLRTELEKITKALKSNKPIGPIVNKINKQLQ